MGYNEVLKKLQDTLKKIEIEDIRTEELFKVALSRKELSEAIGLSIRSISHSLHKLLVEDRIIILKQQADLRQSKYIIKNKQTKKIWDS